MIIDIHAHPVLLDVINEDPEDLSFRKQQFGVFKSGRNPIEFEKLLIEMQGLIKLYGFRKTIPLRWEDPLSAMKRWKRS